MGSKIFETSVVSTLRDNAKSIVGNTGEWQITPELDSGYGIADLALFCFDKNKLRTRLKTAKHPILSSQAIKTLIAMREAGKPIAVSYLTKQLGISEQQMKYKIIKFLEESGYIIKANGLFEFNYFEEIFEKSVAIEAKISNWKRGLYQAYRYKWFSNQSFLALHHRYINPAKKNIETFKDLNVGLLCVYEDRVEIIFNPKSEKPMSANMSILASEKAFNCYLNRPLPKSQ